MDLIDKQLGDYSAAFSTPESPLLKKINRDTHANVLRPNMLSGHLQGRVLSMISHMIRPSLILEIGTYTGYSAICMSEGLKPGGRLITLEKNPELEQRLITTFKEAGLSETIVLKVGNARETIPLLNETFDLVFIDADKESYPEYYEMVIGKVRAGGYILADNVLRSGRVLDAQPDKDTRAILEFNRKVQDDPRVENVLLPIRDGIMMIRKL